VRALDIVETARRYVPEMRARGADLVVAIPHSGLEFGTTVMFAENVVAKLSELPGIDAILFGHSHGEFPGTFFGRHPKVDLARGTINGVPAVMPGAWGSHLGVIDLTLDNGSGRWTVTDSRAHLRPVWDRATRKPLVDADPAITALIAREHAATLAQMGAEVARTTAPITSYFAQVADDPSVQVVSQAQLAYARKALKGTPHEAAAAVRRGALQGRRAHGLGLLHRPAGRAGGAAPHRVAVHLPQHREGGEGQRRHGARMAGDVGRAVQPHRPRRGACAEPDQRRLPHLQLRHDRRRDLHHRRHPTGTLRTPTASWWRPQSRRIVDLRHAGQPVDDTASFIVVTNNYRASGGGSFPGLDGTQIVLDAPDENRQALAQYLAAAGTFDPSADGNWRLAPVPGVKLRFTSGQGGVAAPRTLPIGPAGEGQRRRLRAVRDRAVKRRSGGFAA
jgi:2',3'-cyclic-nucleotide 2'-phosphodiesterase/3'-nucleotidase